MGFMQEMDSLRCLLHLWSFPQQQGFPSATIVFSHYLFYLSETNTELAHGMEGKAARLLEERGKKCLLPAIQAYS